MTDPLDRPQETLASDLRARLVRAAAWRSRNVASPAVRADATHLPLLLLPPELMGIGRVAGTLAARGGGALWARACDVRLGNAPAARIGWLPPAQLTAWLAAGHPALDDGDLAGHEQTPLSVDGDDHPVSVLIHFLDSCGLAHCLPGPESLPPVAADLLDRCDQSVPTCDNPAKQLALRLHERVPVFCGAGGDAAIGEDWAMRVQWLAETAAWHVDASSLARSTVLARLPRYWPNSACFVAFQADREADGDPLLQATLALLRRRRFAVHAVTVPAGLSDGQRSRVLLEVGEWVALYAAMLHESEPGARTPHAILFAP